MPKSKSRSTQTQTTANTSSQLNLENIDGTAIVGNNNTVTNTDYDAIDSAFDFASQNNEDAFTFAGGAFTTAVDAVDTATGRAIDATLQSSENALLFGAGVIQENSQLARDAMAVSENAREDALTFAAGTINAFGEASQSAIDSANQSRIDAFTFAGGVVNQNNELIAGTTQLALAESAAAREDALEFGAGALLAVESSFNSALQSAERAQAEANTIATKSLDSAKSAFSSAIASNKEATQNALTFAGGAFTSAVDEIAENAQNTQELLTQFAGTTINTAVQSTKSEAAQAVDKIIDLTGDTQKNILYMVAGVAGLFLLLRRG